MRNTVTIFGWLFIGMAVMLSVVSWYAYTLWQETRNNDLWLAHTEHRIDELTAIADQMTNICNQYLGEPYFTDYGNDQSSQ